MEVNLFTAGVPASLGGTLASPSPNRVGLGPRFEALLNQPPTQSNRNAANGFADQYVDDLAPPVVSSSRPMAMPAEWVSSGQKFIDDFKAQRLETHKLFEQSQSPSPVMKRYRAQLDALVKIQDSLTQYSLVMKGIELSSQSAQQLFKMQG
jgi:hypothetical protein